MRLLNTTTIRLEEFNEAICPPYAILSHTWGDEEVSFQEMQLEKHPIWKAGYPKIIETCREALEHHLHYAWIDTCCIDKSSSAELSEAINSMFQWYAKASICFAFLSDIPVGVDPFETMNSRWYTRGWTLQELIAPRIILFYNSDWEMIGSRDDLRYKISASTGIDAHFLRDHIPDIHLELSSASIAQRMSWAAGRQTTRTEDMAYCLLGIFGINMPLLYGEGERAFIRLQEEIIRHTNDHSIFAWDLNSPLRQSGGHTGVDLKGAGVFATTPSAFAGSSAVVSIETGEVSTPFFLTNSGIQIDLRVFKEGNSMYGILRCQNGHAASLIAIPLTALPGNVFGRKLGKGSRSVMQEQWNQTAAKPIYLATTSVRHEKYRIPYDSLLVKPLPYGVVWGGVSGGYRYERTTHLITPGWYEATARSGATEREIGVIFNKGSGLDSLSILITLHPLHGHLWAEGVHTFTYEVKRTNSQLEYDWFASVKSRKVFGRSILTIDVHVGRRRVLVFHPQVRVIYLSRARMVLRSLVYRFVIRPTDDITSREIFRHRSVVLEFAVARPVVIAALVMLRNHPHILATLWRPRNLDDAQFIGLSGFLLGWQSSLMAGFCFWMHILAAQILRGFAWVNVGAILFSGLFFAGWLIPLRQRYKSVIEAR